MRLEQLEARETPSVSIFDTATLHEYADGITVVSAGPGGGPRVDVYRNDTPVAAFFAFEDTFRGGVNVDYADDTLLVGAGIGGAPVEARYVVGDGSVVEVSRRFRDDLVPITDRSGWVPNVDPIILLMQHPTLPVADPWILDSYARDLNRVPREIQRQLADAGLRVFVHSSPHLLTDADGRPHRTFYVPAVKTIYLGYGGGIVHEMGHAYDHLVRGGSGSEVFAEAFASWCYFGGPMP